jgi:hypothetical protein
VFGFNDGIEVFASSRGSNRLKESALVRGGSEERFARSELEREFIISGQRLLMSRHYLASHVGCHRSIRTEDKSERN